MIRSKVITTPRKEELAMTLQAPAQTADEVLSPQPLRIIDLGESVLTTCLWRPFHQATDLHASSSSSSRACRRLLEH